MMDHAGRSSRLFHFILFASVFSVFGLISGCGGGGGGGGSSASGTFFPGEGEVALMAVLYPEILGDLEGGSTSPPESASLGQQVVFKFSGEPEGMPGYNSLQIYAEAGSDYSGPESVLDRDRNIVPGRGVWEKIGNLVVFTPYVPTVPIDLSRGAPEDAVPGLLPDMEYTVYIPVGTGNSIKNLIGVQPWVPNPGYFTTCSSDFPNFYYDNHPDVAPSVLSSVPADGETDVSLHAMWWKSHREHVDDPGNEIPNFQIPGFPTERDFSLMFDRPLLSTDENIKGIDLDEDGLTDRNMFYLYATPLAYASLDEFGGGDPGIVSIDRETGDVTFIGVTETLFPIQYTVGLTSVALMRSGRMYGTSGTALFEVEYHTLTTPGICGLSPIGNIPGYGDLRAFCAAPDGRLLALSESTSRMISIDPETGGVLEETDLEVGHGIYTDLAARADGTLFCVAVIGSGQPGAQTTLLEIDPDSGDGTVLYSGTGDYTSLSLVGFTKLSLYSGPGLAVDLFDLETLRFESGGTYTLSGSGFTLLDESPLAFRNVNAELDAEAQLVSNTIDGADVQLNPSGILPFGERVEIMVRRGLANLTLTSIATVQGEHPLEADPVATFYTHSPSSNAVDDVFFEDFLNTDWEATVTDFIDEASARSEVVPAANWDITDVDGDAPHYKHLLATYGLTGEGNLGDFKPSGIYPVVILDTDYQVLPLYDGSTPDVKEHMVVTTGAFHFENIEIPANVTVVGRGTNPLVLTATGTILVEGTIDVSGMEGMDDDTFDSAFTPTPGGIGGAGGGRGGDAHPATPTNFQNLTDLRSPKTAEDGWGYSNLVQAGGKGGESGAKGTNAPWKGGSQGDDKLARGSGGGGGTFLMEGGYGYLGFGKYYTDPDDPRFSSSNRYFERDFWEFYDGHPQPTPGVNRYDTQDTPGGAAGDIVFKDSDPENDFIGNGGELSFLRGGQGGGGGGTRLDSMNPATINAAAGWFPPVDRSAYDAKGGGGGGGGGALGLYALGEITVTSTGALLARGGIGGGGEVIGHSNFGGGGGAGSGGAIIVDSALRITIEQDAEIDVSGGWPGDAKEVHKYTVNELKGNPCLNIDGDPKKHKASFCSWSVGDGGYGGCGIVQLQVPPPFADNLVGTYWQTAAFAEICEIDWEEQICDGNDPIYNPDCGCSKTGDNCARTYWHYVVERVGSDPSFPITHDCLIDPEKTPTTLGPISNGMSRWIDTGQVIHRGDVNGSPAPLYLAFEGILADGTVMTENGKIPNPDLSDIRVDAPDVMPPPPQGSTFYIPEDNEVKVLFQGADAIVAGSSIPDPATIVPGPGQWTADLSDLAGKQFIRFIITLNTATSGQVDPLSTKPQVNYVRIRMQY